ncbi:MAG: protein tyrosine phosphatase [Bacteroidetes bacterium]|nr:MAG: protein tyrosine phosphatase [Bacteroidota bacterium]PTM11249.1 MAG: protein tyrosine phosphatase [Bacteroidota bacterium]
MKKILVLCTGNACRSQMAEAYLRFFTQGKAEVYSAGINPHAVHPLAISVMREDNIDISNAYSKSVAEFSGENFDYLITVCAHAEEKKPADISAELFYHYDIPDPEEAVEMKVEEPFSVFSNTRELIKREMLRFIGKHVELTITSEASEM